MSTCPNCSEPVHDLASFCPGCGTELQGPGRVPQHADPPPPPASGWSRQTILLAIGGLLVVVAAGYWLFANLAVRRSATMATPTAAFPLAAPQMVSASQQLKTIGLALHNYHDVHGMFPPGAIVDDKQVPHHGWQTALLPFIGHAQLYEGIDFNTAWNAPEQNQWIFQQSIREYRMPGIPESFDLSGYSISHYAGNSRAFRDNVGLSIREIVDGTSNTIFAGEVIDGFKPWGDPTNRRDPAAGLTGTPETFGSYNGVVLFLKADGSVVPISPNVDPQVLKALSTPDGGEPLPDDF